jgi:pSer/pThr/pTyr-binding forkhead associated (FHA) protein
MTVCDRCSTDNLDGAQYCDECGAFLNTAVRAKKSVDTGDTGGGTDDKLMSEPMSESMSESMSDAALSEKPKSEAKQPSRAYAISQGSISLMEGAHAKLVIERGRSAGKQFPLSEDESQIGRWDADGGIFPDVDLDADDPEAKVSRRHARIVRRNGQYLIEDLGSTNGTFINRGRRLLPGDRQPLRDGDEIIVGKTFLRFHVVK